MKKEKITFKEWTLANQIETEEDVEGILEAVLELAIRENDPEYLFAAVGEIARSKGMAKIAKELNLDRASLYKSLSPKGNPSFFTVARVLHNLGYNLNIRYRQN